ncbi:3' terminal RNA ribose 2'-O-methyltransferase Hen1 [Kitasatospora sp. A2-31]|uniref:3' terminal RNA ribose 2'-O-methyltransferase Hen1 n=1 Tax=Kitasatospora sp. A2-31 TaxID=2916414 RepID=UPI001EE922CE|nr:3' terminal RNA ribose 2'-O-methyltransferase Hen1 [Kitasatospora sp. A2-31]MCG6493638.1 3' terminal RNA ribose 2'-O-methyltransferase Hen1 [Kitasatospora sp. A2-31]
MFMSISTTGTAESPASDLGFLLHKHPGKVQRFSTSHGEAHVFYPEAGDELCTAALLLDIDPIALVRKGRGKGRGGSPDFALAQYVNDRPYAASSLLAVALRTVFRTAMKGVCEARPGLAELPRPLRISLPAVPANGAGESGGPAMAARLFEPLGWQVQASAIPLDEAFPEWGESRYVRLELAGTEVRLADALQQLYVLLPVLDGAKHYWVAPDEVDKLLAAGAGWLADHPEQALIARRYLSRRWALTRRAMERLELARLAEADDREVEEIDNAVDDSADESADDSVNTVDAAAGGTVGAAEAGDGRAEHPEPAAERKASLADQRRAAILAALGEVGAARVADLGCGQGELIGALLKDARFTEVLGVDVSARALSAAARKLRLERMSERQAARVRLVQGALTYTDARLKGFDAAVLCEVIEHLDLPRLPALEHAVFGAARPSAVVVTTPNAEYNVRWESLPAGHVRHADHRFEWDRVQFREWAERVAATYGYTAVIRPVGPEDAEVGAPTQLALFRIGGPPDAAPQPAPAPAVPATAVPAPTDTTTTPEGGETR